MSASSLPAQRHHSIFHAMPQCLSTTTLHDAMPVIISLSHTLYGSSASGLTESINTPAIAGAARRTSPPAIHAAIIPTTLPPYMYDFNIKIQPTNWSLLIARLSHHYLIYMTVRGMRRPRKHFGQHPAHHATRRPCLLSFMIYVDEKDARVGA